MHSTATDPIVACYHCGEDCTHTRIKVEEKVFCCDGCKMVYQLLNQNGLCDYYNLNEAPGKNQRIQVRKDKFAFLDDEKIQQQLISFQNKEQVHITFYLPQVHCSSCLYLLENLHQLEKGVISANVNFPRKEVSVVIDPSQTSIRVVAELLTSIGYEPYISLNNLKEHRPRVSKTMIFQLGVAGFCFGNIMLMSFPEYLGLAEQEKDLQTVFRSLNFILALPVFFFSALPFYISGWKGIKHNFLNIDAPIALAIIVTFGRSVYEVLTGTGAGYFDSMSGIVFFMLVGRVLQDKTYQQLSFERDYTSYFPVAVSVIKEKKEIPTQLPDILPGDTLLIHNEELIPADGILTRGKALIDYSFVTGESIPVEKEMGEIIYAGGKQVAGNIELLVIKEVTQSYLTRLWSGEQFKKENEEKGISFVHLLSRYFTAILFTIAILAAGYWFFNDGSKIWNVVTAVLIVACPCALLLSNTFTNGNILRILGRNKFYLRNAQVIEEIANVDHIVFDKTGTMTSTHFQDVVYEGERLSPAEEELVSILSSQSNHPLSRALVQHFGKSRAEENALTNFEEIPGKGLEGSWNGIRMRIGSKSFVTGSNDKNNPSTQVWVMANEQVKGYFSIRNHYREEIPTLLKTLSSRYTLSVLSGDNAGEEANLRKLLGPQATLLFEQKPEQKLAYIQSLQQKGAKVMMIGDGLNDAGALKQSNAGVALAEDSNNFTPASDAILEAGQLKKFTSLLYLCKANKRIVQAAFIISILYNIVGISFAVQGVLSPLKAAILMPASSISILLITFGSSNLISRWLRL